MEKETVKSSVLSFLSRMPYPVLMGPCMDRGLYRFSSVEEVKIKQRELAACMLEEVVQTALDKDENKSDEAASKDDAKCA